MSKTRKNVAEKSITSQSAGDNAVVGKTKSPFSSFIGKTIIINHKHNSLEVVSNPLVAQNSKQLFGDKVDFFVVGEQELKRVEQLYKEYPNNNFDNHRGQK